MKALVFSLGCLALFPALAMTIQSGAPATGVSVDYYPVAGGVSGRDNAPVQLPKSSNSMRVEYRLAEAEIGASQTTEPPLWHIGDFLADDAIPEHVDWVKTWEACQANKHIVDRVRFLESSTETARRVLFIGGGNVTIPWQFTDGTALTNGYSVGKTVSVRPHRLFWTEGTPRADSEDQPYNAPPINLNGKFVKIFGDPDVLKLTYGPPLIEGGSSNILSGVYIEAGSGTLHAKANAGVGPEGQFVLAYYDTADHRKLIGVTVVEVLRPDPQTVRVYVGDRLLPTGVGYGRDGLTPIVQHGMTQTFGTNGKNGGPWIEQFAALTPFSEKSNALYAISPTDKSTSSNDAVHPHDADVFWEAPDAMGTLWPFEEVWYEISWNEDDVLLVTEKGTPSKLFVPTNYTASVLTFMVDANGEPSSFASIDSENQVTVNQPGRFLLKLNFDDDVRYLPIHAVDRTDPLVGTLSKGNDPDVWVDVGSTLRPPSGASFTNRGFEKLGAYAEFFASSRVGSIATNRSEKVWNPHLYHEPRQSMLSVSSPDDLQADPLDGLKSAICLVRPTSTNEVVEVTWSYDLTQTRRGESLPYPISVNGLVAKYGAKWPAVCHEIALTSKKGSAVPTQAPSRRAFQFGTNGVLFATADMLNGGKTVFAADEPISVGLWVCVEPSNGDGTACAPGRLAAIQFEDGKEVVLLLAGEKGRRSLSLLINGAVALSEIGTIESNKWTHVALSFDPDPDQAKRAITLYVDGKPSDVAAQLPLGTDGNTHLMRLAVGDLSEGAVGWAADEISVWNLELSENLLKTLWASDGKGREKTFADNELFRFDAGAMLGEAKMSDATDAYRYALDAQGRGALKIEGAPTELEPGAPVVASGDVTESDGVTPRIYRQTDSTQPGYRPNYEHAFIDNGTVWALRNDQSENQESYVLVEYGDLGYGAMRTYRVINDTAQFPAEDEVVVSRQETPPYPLRLLEGYWNTNNTHAVDRNSSSCVWHRDRKLNDWARRDGKDEVCYWYLPRSDFDMNKDYTIAKSADGYVLWLGTNATNGAKWTWNAVWPSSAPVMSIAQTLTKQVNGLPEVWNMASCDLLYPAKAVDYKDENPSNNVVRLVDPVTAKTARLPIERQFTTEYGFEVGPSGTTTLRQGKYYFHNLPPSIADRFYVDTNADEAKRMVLVGDLQEPAAGNPYLRWNLLDDQEAEALREICPEGATKKAEWDAAVAALAANGLDSIETRRNEPVANYALFADGNGSGWVTFIENDSTNRNMVAEGDPINVKVVFVTNTLYAGTCMTVQSRLNKLSELLTVQYNDAFPAMMGNFDLVWYRYNGGTPEDGTVPDTSRIPNDENWYEYQGGRNRTSFILGKTGTTLQDLVNTYYCLRYVPKPGTAAARTCGTDTGVTTDPALAEGWVQRVLNAVTPFAQRVEDFYSNPSDIAYTMFEQIGKPYRGDVALNNDNLTEIGLLELYRTVFEKAWKLSLGVGVRNDAGVDKQLMQAASRIADLYQILGAEAYADAKNPLISQGFNDTYLAELQNLPSSTFCFQNQVRTLLDEELALLRGRELGDAPNMTTQPCFNRLYWNFTKGITEGEVAYVNNYGIRADQGVLTIDQAAQQYPQGHGDAWGHYLSSIQLYYRLLRNDCFDWFTTKMEMNLSAAVANEDYYDEQKFADSAVKLAQIGLDTTDLTARKAWRDRGGDVQGGYGDANAEQAFGYGEWATRTMLGGLYNWVTVNALLPPVAAAEGLNRIDRSTVTQLGELCTLVDRVQQKVNTLDAGLNPLGLSQNAVPMDIDPDALAAKNSHFDQILERAERALANCEQVLAYANQYGARLQQIQNAETTALTEQENTEANYNRDLIAIYGTPYPGDIGTGCLYEQGYDGPDLYHYMYMDLEEFGLAKDELEVAFSTNLFLYTVGRTAADGHGEATSYSTSKFDTNSMISVHYDVSSGGVVLKPDNFGVRLREGRLQTAYRAYLDAYVKAKRACGAYDVSVGTMNEWALYAYQHYAMKEAKYVAKTAGDTLLAGLTLAKKTKQEADYVITNAGNVVMQDLKMEVNAAPGQQVAGTSYSINMREFFLQGIKPLIQGITLQKKSVEETGYIEEKIIDSFKLSYETAMNNYDNAISMFENEHDTIDKYWNLVGDVKKAAYAVQDAIGALATAEAAYRAVVAEGEALQAERERIRKQQSNTATQYRYADMYNRVQRNNALTKYSTAFDSAQRYVWELAKVYDYETGLLSSDPQAGDKFLAEIIGSRQLGWPGVSTSQATDKGLYDIVNRMKENWAVLKGRLGVNNPANTATEFSLRYELFRIKPDATGDGAWQDELKKYWVDDLKANSDYLRYCQPLVSTAGPVAKEPGLVIPFSTVINNAENFFGKTLQGGDHAYSSADYATKIHAVGVAFDGYDALTAQTAAGLAADPNVYLVPAGHDYLRAPSGDAEPAVLAWNVVDQVLPLPYAVGSTQLDDPDWIATFSGLDGTSDSAAKIRRHSTLRANGETYATRLVGRSVWNDRWILVIPASSLNANREAGLTTFVNGVKDIKLRIQAYSRSGN